MSISLSRFCEVLFAIEENSIVKAIRKVWPGTVVHEIIIEEAITYYDGFGLRQRRESCPVYEVDSVVSSGVDNRPKT